MRRFPLLLLLPLFGFGLLFVRQSALARHPLPDPGIASRIDRHLRSIESDLVALRRDLHEHPEISGEEERTAGIVAERLRRLGLEVRTGVGGHGVVGILRGGQPGPRVALRADMDAVRSNDPDPVPFRSKDPTKRHICGHDVHVAVALGVASVLAEERGFVPGTIVFVFQPAEERATGARAMLADSVFRDGMPKAIYAFHTAPLEVGTIGSGPGVQLAGRDRFTLRLEGDAAAADSAAAELERTIQRLSDTTDRAQAFAPRPTPFRVVMGSRSTRDAGGSGWTIAGQLSITSDSLRDDTERTLRAALAAWAQRGVRGTLDYRRREVEGLDNDPALEERARSVLRAALGDSAVILSRRVPPAFSEDFGSFQAEIPGVMLWLGVANAAKGHGGMPHSPDYVADEGAILVGARAMSHVLLDALGSR